MIITLVAFFFVLSLLVIVHEFGHYAVAKLGGIGVERFSIGLPPRLFGIKFGETDYCVSAIPFGGYVKLTGQEDFDEEEAYTHDPKDYRGKSSPLKFAVLIAGSLMNILTAVVIFSLLFYINGVQENTTVIGFVEQGTLSHEMGLKPGDEIVEVQGKEVERFDEILIPLYMDENVTLTVKNLEGQRVITSPRKLEQKEDFGLIPHQEARVGVVSGSPAEKAGVLRNDIITAIDGEPVFGWYQMSTIVRANPDKEMTFTFLRDGKEINLPVVIGHVSEDLPDGTRKTVGRIGVSLQASTRDVSLLESTRVAAGYTVFVATHVVDFFVRLITGRMSSKLLGGPVMIAQMAGESARMGFSTLMGFTAFFSINLGILNLIPFPVLDGGHIFILLIEGIVRKKVSLKIKLALQQMGTVILLLFMLYITFNDVMRFETISKLFGGG